MPAHFIPVSSASASDSKLVGYLLYVGMTKNPFESFWMAGYECTDKLNAFGNRVDFLQETGHLELIGKDYQLLETFDIGTVREGLRWSKVETRPYTYDWSDAELMIRAGKTAGIQQVWDLCHFGYPDDLTPLHPMFARRLAAFARAFVKFYRSVEPDSTLIVTPINEVSFISWLGGQVGGTSPYCTGQGWAVKYRLMKGYIEAIEAMLQEDPSIRILTTEPLVNIIAGPDASPQDIIDARNANEDQFQVLEMLSGAMCPELNGKPQYLDLLGFNYYFDNQWIFRNTQRLPWDMPEKFGGVTLEKLLTDVYHRYRRPMILAETSHPGEDRPKWIEHIARECSKVLQKDLPLWGICWYPIIDRPDWDHLTPWHNAGLWDNITGIKGQHERILNTETAEAFLAAQEQLLLAREPDLLQPDFLYAQQTPVL